MPPRKPLAGDRRDEVPTTGDDVEGGHWVDRKMWLERRRGLYADGPRILARASEARAEEELMAPKAPPGAPGSRNWTPIGPSAVGFGQAAGEPVVSGRVLGIEVGPGSAHAYAGVADGGVWRWRRDTSVVPPFEHWEPQDDFVLAPTAPRAAANALSVGDIAVVFDPGANPDLDTIFVGTGEGHVNRVMGTVGGSYFGVGVRVSPPVVPGGARTWTLETYATVAPVQPATFRLVLDPDTATRPWAATTGGLHRRPVAPGPWPRVGTGGAKPLPAGMVTDVRVTGTAAAGNKTVYAAVNNVGVLQSTDDGGTWNQLAGLPPGLVAPGRISLALDESVAHTTVVYALCQNPSGSAVNRQLFRFAVADGQFREVDRMPGAPAFTRGQGDYDLAIAVAPGNVNRVLLAGAVVRSDGTTQFEWELAAFRGDITNPAANVFRFGFTAANDHETRAHGDATFVGRGVHGDGHCIAFGRSPASAELATDVWIGCDGGVFRSLASGNNGSFAAVNTGLATVQLTYLDNHPTHESVVIAGCQDNGVVRTWGDATWLENPKSDGGGVAIDQTFPWRMIGQTFNDDFYVSANAGREWRRVQIGGAEGVGFYIQLCSAPPTGGPPPPVATPNPGWCLAGTTRVWATYDWGNTWVTLPAATTPPPGNVLQDVLDGRLVTAVAWPTTNRLYAATQTAVYRIDYNAVAAAWVAPLALGAPPGLAPGLREITDIAVANAAADDLYVTLGGVGEHVWWYDQPAATWRNTGSLARFNAPAQAVEVDPGLPNQVWVGTDVGVYHATHVRPAGVVPRSWTWTPAPGASQGLPEAAVTDLQIQASTQLLRAATHGRGAWELPVAVNVGRDPDLFLRMNPADSGRRLVTARTTADPTRIRRDNLTPINVDWGDSPDLKVRRGIAAQAPHPFSGTLRLQSPRMVHARVRRWQRYAIRRGIDLGVGGADAEFGPDTEAAVRELQRRHGLLVWSNGNVTDGVVGPRTWAATAGYPALAARIDHRAFTMDVQEDHVEATGLLLGDATGTNRVFLQLHNRGSRSLPPARVRALLLLAAQNGAGAVPDLPAGWDARIGNADTGAWTGAWAFADPGAPYRSPVVPLGSREPQVVEWNVDFAARGFNVGDIVVLLAFLTTTAPGVPADPADVLTNAERRVRQLVEGERRVAARRVRLDVVGNVP